jgi:hypothetical protein
LNLRGGQPVLLFAEFAADFREPSALHLRRRERRVGLLRAEFFQVVAHVFFHAEARVKIRAVKYAAQHAVLHPANRLRPAGEKRHVDSAGNRVLRERGEVRQHHVGGQLRVVVFVFDLEKNHARRTRRLARDLVLRDERAHRVVPMLAPRKKNRVVRAEPHFLAQRLRRFFRREPLRKSAAVPLRANVRTGPDQNIKPELLRHRQPLVEIAQIDLGKIVERLRHLALVPVPRDVAFHGIETGILYFLKTVAPQFLRAAEIMKRAAENERVLAVNREAISVVADAVGMRERPWLLGCGGAD